MALPLEEKVDVASSYKQVVFFGAVPVSTTRRYNKPVAVRIKIKVEDAVSEERSSASCGECTGAT